MAEAWLVLDALGDVRGGDAVRGALQVQAARMGKRLRVMRVDEMPIAPCRGCFGCWTRTPGICVMNDPAREITAGLADADALVVLTPVVCGGYAPTAKTAVDRGVLPMLLPHFQRVNGRTRHFPRYEKSPALVAIGLMPGPDAEAEQVFAGLASRNAANLRSPAHAGVVVTADMPPEGVAEVVARALGFVRNPAPEAMRRIVLLCGSPKAKGSVSQGFAAYAEKLLRESGMAIEKFDLLAVGRDEEKFAHMAAAVDDADGVWLFSPLYADQLPGHTLGVLARLAAWRKEIPPKKTQRFSVVINCGFPERENNDAALAMCRLFARDAGFAWLGGCGVGGGGFYEGRSPEAFGWLGRKVRDALSRKAQLFAAPNVPDISETGDIAVPCPVPAWLYLFLAELGWKKALGGKKVVVDSRARPFARRAD